MKRSKKLGPKSNEKGPSNVIGIKGAQAKPRIDRNYLQALKGYWENRTRTAVERLTQIIVDEEDPTKTFPLYRLWIEVLSSGRDLAALKKLVDHMHFLGEAEAEHTGTFLALRGLIHFELDEIDAASTIARSLRKETHNLYGLELRQLIEDRTSPRFKKPLLLSQEHNLRDYFHFESLAKSLVLRNENQAFHILGRRIREIFPESPLIESIELMSFVTKGEYRSGIHLANQLVAKFPGNVEYSIQLAYVATRARDFDTAITELTRAANLHTEVDGDALSLLGYALAEKALLQNDADIAERAVEQLSKAIEYYTDAGIPINFPQENLERINKAFTKNGPMETSMKRRNWLIKLSARKYHELKDTPLEHVKKIRCPMGSAPRCGDFCFLVGDDYRNHDAGPNDQHWRLGAIYEITSDPFWHPLAQFQSRLTLVTRPEISIPIAVHEFDRDDAPPARHKDPLNPVDFGVYELSPSALQGIEEAIEEFSSEFSDLKLAVR